MLRAFWFAIKVGLLVTLAVWVANRPGVIELSWQDYNVRADTGLVLVALLAVLFIALVLYRLFLALSRMPHKFRQHMADHRRQQGWRSLTLGLTAIAAGDRKLADYHAQRTRRLLPADKGLSVLLEAQAARLIGDNFKAEEYYRQLLENKDTAFLGFKGLVQAAIDDGDYNRAKTYAYDALELHRKQPWTLRMVYELELRQGHWEQAEKILKRLKKNKIISAGHFVSDQTALLIQEADDARLKGLDDIALAKLRLAHKKSPSFVPLAERLASIYLKRGKKRSAASVIRKTWRENPHKALVPLWMQAVPKKQAKSDAGMLKWAEQLAAQNPENFESTMALAYQAVEHNLWGAAETYLVRAEEQRPSARLYRLWATLEEAQGDMNKALQMREKAEDAPADKVWVCKKTGRIYDDWSPVARPHGSFNTIVWGYPDEIVPEPLLVGDKHLAIE